MASKKPVYLTRSQSRAVDEIAIRDYGMLGLVLMENAGRGCASFICRFLEENPKCKDWPIVICCGKGNNGGDGFVIARTLSSWEIDATTLLWAAPSELTGDAAANYAILEKMQAQIATLGDDNWEATLTAIPSGKVILIDALLGTGAQGEPRAPYDKAIAWINSLRGMVFAVDLPSGLDADKGAPSRNTVKADYTLTFVSYKAGFAAAGAKEYLGTTHVIDIGAPRKVIEAAMQIV